MKTMTMGRAAIAKATRLLLATVLLLGLMPTVAQADQGTMSVDYGRYLEFRQSDPSTNNYNWADNAMTINGHEVLCTDISAMVVHGASYASSPMDADTALRWGLYNQYLGSLGWGRLKVLGYLQYMIWSEANADYIAANGVYPNTSDFWDVYGRAKDYYNANKAYYVGEGINWHSASSQSACGIPSVRAATGYIDLLKVSAQPSITNDNECYSLEGAVYGVFSDAACANPPVDELTTDASGWAKSGALRVGTYYVRETARPLGYAVDKRVYQVTVESGQTVRVNAAEGGKVADLPQGDPADALLYKYDGERAYGANNLPQGSASLAFAQFRISYYGGNYSLDELAGKTPMREWVMQTDEDGYTSLYYGDGTFEAADGSTHPYKVSGSDFWRSAAGNVMIPLGTIAVTEVAAPEGYVLPDPAPVYVQHVVARGSGAAIEGEEIDAYNAPEVPEQVIRGGVRILKLDADTGLNQPEGAATIEGAKIAIRSENENGVIVGGREYTKGDTVMTLTTVAGAASTANDALPYGRYSYVETAPPEGYLVDSTVRTFDIARDGEVVTLEANRAVSDKVMRGDLALVKVAQRQPTTGGSGMLDPLTGVSFDIVNDNPNPVMRPDGSLANKGDTVVTITTDDRGYAETTGGALAYGSYIVHEDAATVPHGYATVEDFRVTVAQDGQELYYVLEDGTGTPIRVVKTDAETGEQIAGYTTFRILDKDMKPVTFTRYYPSVSHMTSFVTDATGSCMLPERLNGGEQYYLQEIGAPEGYVLNGAVIPFVPDGDGGYTWANPLTVTLSDRAQTGIIEIVKVDAETGKPVALPGIVYDVIAAEDIVTNDGTVRALAGEVVATIESGEDGIARTDELHLGLYACIEREAPEGYLLNDEPVEVEIEYAGQTVEITRAGATVADRPQKGIVTVSKTDATTGEPIKVPGVEYRIEAAEDVATPDGTVRAHAGDVVATMVTDERGVAESPELHLGAYDVYEVRQPDGMVLDNTRHRAVLEYAGQSVAISRTQINATNTPTRIEVVKVRADDGAPLAGVEFSYWNEVDEHEIAYTDGYGVAAVSVEPSDAIDVRSVALVAADDIVGVSPDAMGDGSGAMPDEALLYRAGDTVAVMEQDGAGVYVSSNAPCGSYELVCTYSYNGSPESTMDAKLADVEISGSAPRAFYAAVASSGVAEDGATLTNWDVQAVPAFVSPDKLNKAETDADGRLEILRLSPGTYGFAESRSLPGYVMDATARYLTVGIDGLIDGEQVGHLMYANECTHLEIAKVDAATGEPVAGAQLELYAAPAPGALDDAGNPAVYGKLYDAWTSGDSAHAISTIPAGDYVLHEVAPPESYFLGADMAVRIDGTTADVQLVSMSNDYTRVDMVKVDAETGTALPGAALVLMDAEGGYVDPREYVATTAEAGSIPEYSEVVFDDDGKPSGTAPVGSSDKVSWVLKDVWGETVAEWSGLTPPADEVLAALAEAGNGSHMVKNITPDEDAVVCWTSTEGPVRFEGLKPGAYTLVEIACPDGYLMAEPVEVDVEAIGDVQIVTMADEIDAETYDKTGAQLAGFAPWAALAAAAAVACVVAVALRRRSVKRRA